MMNYLITHKLREFAVNSKKNKKVKYAGIILTRKKTEMISKYNMLCMFIR